MSETRSNPLICLDVHCRIRKVRASEGWFYHRDSSYLSVEFKDLLSSQVSHKLYGRNYIQVYICALVIITLNILLTNIFLNNEFLTYAFNVIKFGAVYQDRLFPKMSKCSFYR